MLKKLKNCKFRSSSTSWSILIILFYIKLSTSLKESGVSGGKSGEKCEEITIPMCKGIGYNHTKMPNQFNHDSQEEAGMEVHQYWPLVEIKCSPDLRLFICSLYVPICMEDYSYEVPPCRSVCERSRHGCEPIMKQYSFQWPEKMNCNRFPNFGRHNICMDEKNGEMPKNEVPKYGIGGGGVISSTTNKGVSPGIYNNNNNVKMTNFGGGGGGSSSNSNGGSASFPSPGFSPGGVVVVDKKCDCECRSPLIKLDESHYFFNRTGHLIETGSVPNCALPCHGAYNSEDEKNFSKYWISMWAGLCCFTSFFTLITFIINPLRFQYPERGIIYLSSCYFMVSIGYLLSIWRGHEEVACRDNIVRYEIETGSPGSVWCLVIFLLIYYFGMASSIWWIIISISWYLAACKKWAVEILSRKANLFHLASWVLPGIASFLAVVDGAVEGDEIAGICFIGSQDSRRLFIYILIPYLSLLILGTSFLLAGFISLIRLRKVIAEQGGHSKTEKLEKLMIRIGVFSVLYTLPASCVIGAHFYEMSLKNAWLLGITCSCKAAIKKPLFSLVMLRYFMSLCVGITTGFWIWSGKTVESWQRFISRCFGRNNSRAASTAKYTNTTYHTPPGKNLTHV